MPLAGLINAAAEAARLEKLIAREQEELARVRGRLANDSFVRNAPSAVVSLERERAAELQRTVASLGVQLQSVRRLLAP